MDRNPKVSVIIPVYNVEKYLRECLDSVIKQSLKEIEIICVNDGSTDSSLEILNEYAAKDSRVKVLSQMKTNAGAARNAGIGIAKGEYFVFWDSDDFFEEKALETEYNQCIRYDADICLCCADCYDTNSGSYKPTPWVLNTSLMDETVVSSESIGEDIYRITNTAPWTKMFSAKFIKENKISFQSVQRANDVYFVMVSLAVAKRIVAVENVLIHYRVGMKENLQANNYKSPLIIFQALRAVKESLIERQVFSRVSFAFRNIALSQCAYNLRKLEDHTNEFNQLCDEILKTGLSFYHLDTLRLQNAYNKKDYQYLLDSLSTYTGKAADSLYDFSSFSKKKTPLVSFIIPVYNEESYLRECLESICNQSLKDIEIICIDDQSSDQSYAIIEEYAKKDDRVKAVKHLYNQHQGGARNTGLEMASGKYVWFIDSDDYIELDAAEKLAGMMDRLQNVDVISFDCKAFKESEHGVEWVSEGEIHRNWPKDTKLVLPDDSEKLPSTLDGSSVTCFSKRVYIDNFRFRPNAVFEDADFSFNVFSEKGVFYETDYAPYYRRITVSSTTGEKTQGESRSCITGRLLASKEIIRIIKRKNLRADYYSVKWFKRWAKWAIGLYLKHEEYFDDTTDQLVRELQNNGRFFKPEDVVSKDQLRRVLIPSIVVSFTTFPKRIATVSTVVQSLLRQTLMPDKVLLYIASAQFADQELPGDLKELEKQNDCFEIRFCDDIKAHKKYFYSMQEYPESVIITVDDDIDYDSRLIEELIKSYIRWPNAVSCMKGHMITINSKGEYGLYRSWRKAEKSYNKPSIRALPIGMGGVLYPPGILPKETFDKDKIGRYLTVDDLWLKWMQLQRDIPAVISGRNLEIKYIESTQEDSLWRQNVSGGSNDLAWNMLTQNDKDSRILKKIMADYIGFMNTELKDLRKEVKRIKSSKSYKVGRIITYFPRTLRKVFKQKKR